MRWILLLLLLALQAFSGCTESTPPLDGIEMTDDEYYVLSNLFDYLLPNWRDSTVYLSDSTGPGVDRFQLDSTLALVGRLVPQTRADASADFITKNRESVKIRRPSLISEGCILVSGRTLRYPLLGVSRVGFSSDGNQAMAFVAFTSYFLAGEGRIFVLQRVDGRWVIQGSVTLWIS
jgi:hypothetical protein